MEHCFWGTQSKAWTRGRSFLGAAKLSGLHALEREYGPPVALNDPSIAFFSDIQLSGQFMSPDFSVLLLCFRPALAFVRKTENWGITCSPILGELRV